MQPSVRLRLGKPGSRDTMRRALSMRDGWQAELGYMTDIFVQEAERAAQAARISEPAHYAELSATLEALSLAYLAISHLPKPVSSFGQLRSLDLHRNELLELPLELTLLPNLSHLDCSYNSITSLPSCFEALTALSSLDLSNNRLRVLPASLVRRLTNLTSLNASQNEIVCFDELHLELFENDDDDDDNHNHNASTQTSSPVQSQLHLVLQQQQHELQQQHQQHQRQELAADSPRQTRHSQSETLWFSMTLGAQLEELDLSFNQIAAIPPKLFSKLGGSLRKLNLTANTDMAHCWRCLPVLTRLESLECGFTNATTDACYAIAQLSCLTQLDLRNNRITDLPPSMCLALTRLTHLNLSANRLTHLPSSVQLLASLVHLDVSSNLLRLLPPTIVKLPRLQFLLYHQNHNLQSPPEHIRKAGLKSVFEYYRSILPGQFYDEWFLATMTRCCQGKLWNDAELASIIRSNSADVVRRHLEKVYSHFLRRTTTVNAAQEQIRKALVMLLHHDMGTVRAALQLLEPISLTGPSIFEDNGVGVLVNLIERSSTLNFSRLPPKYPLFDPPTVSYLLMQPIPPMPMSRKFARQHAPPPAPAPVAAGVSAAANTISSSTAATNSSSSSSSSGSPSPVATAAAAAPPEIVVSASTPPSPQGAATPPDAPTALSEVPPRDSADTGAAVTANVPVLLVDGAAPAPDRAVAAPAHAPQPPTDPETDPFLDELVGVLSTWTDDPLDDGYYNIYRCTDDLLTANPIRGLATRILANLTLGEPEVAISIYGQGGTLFTMGVLALARAKSSEFLRSLLSYASMGHAIVHREIDASQLKLIGVLGKGASATVYRAIWTPPRDRRGQPAPRLVAVKRFHEQVVDLNEFRTEIAINSILSHPSLMRTCGASTKHPDYLIVAEYFHYGSLYDVLHGREQLLNIRGEFAVPAQFPEPGSLTPEVKLNMALMVAEGVAYLHDMNIIHRDLKSQNFLMNKRMRLVVADLGISRVREKHMTKCIGTPRYMSPELLEGKPYTDKADVYAFGLLLWELFMGRLPFNECTSPWAMSREILEGTRPIIPRNWPLELCELIQRCWSPDEHARPTMRRVVFALRGLSNQAFSSRVPKDKVLNPFPTDRAAKRLGVLEAQPRPAGGSPPPAGTEEPASAASRTKSIFVVHDHSRRRSVSDPVKPNSMFIEESSKPSMDVAPLDTDALESTSSSLALLNRKKGPLLSVFRNASSKVIGRKGGKSHRVSALGQSANVLLPPNSPPYGDSLVPPGAPVVTFATSAPIAAATAATSTTSSRSTSSSFWVASSPSPPGISPATSPPLTAAPSSPTSPPASSSSAAAVEPTAGEGASPPVPLTVPARITPAAAATLRTIGSLKKPIASVTPGSSPNVRPLPQQPAKAPMRKLPSRANRNSGAFLHKAAPYVPVNGVVLHTRLISELKTVIEVTPTDSKELLMRPSCAFPERRLSLTATRLTPRTLLEEQQREERLAAAKPAPPSTAPGVRPPATQPVPIPATVARPFVFSPPSDGSNDAAASNTSSISSPSPSTSASVSSPSPAVAPAGASGDSAASSAGDSSSTAQAAQGAPSTGRKSNRRAGTFVLKKGFDPEDQELDWLQLE